MKRYTDKSVIITGAASGLGKGAALRFAKEGARLVISDLNEAGLEAVARELRAQKAEVVALHGDVSDENDAPRLVEACLSAYGSVDVAINNAGIAHPPMKLPMYTADQARQMFNVNLLSVFLSMKAQIPVMEKQGHGVILNVSSVAGVLGAPMGSTYSAAKHGVIGMTKAAAVECAKKGVRINALCPAFTMTGMVENTLKFMGNDTSEATKRMVATNPMGRIADADEIVQAILWICSAENSFMTGHSLVLDGGLSAI